jgi:lipoprotein signal peptidase
MTINKQKLLPLILAPVITIADQVSKIIVTTTMKPNQIVEVWGNFLRLWYRTNKHNIFGIGTGWPSGLQYLSFLILPLIVLGGALYILKIQVAAGNHHGRGPGEHDRQAVQAGRGCGFHRRQHLRHPGPAASLAHFQSG